MKTVFTIMFLLVCTTVNAGVNFGSVRRIVGVAEYVKDVADYKTKSIDRLKNIIQQVGSHDEVLSNIHAMSAELNDLAIRAGRTTDQDMIELQTTLEDKIKDHLDKILKIYNNGPDKKYFEEIASTIRDLKSFNVPYSAGGVDVIDNSSPGADTHFYSRPFLKANFTHR